MKWHLDLLCMKVPKFYEFISELIRLKKERWLLRGALQFAVLLSILFGISVNIKSHTASVIWLKVKATPPQLLCMQIKNESNWCSEIIKLARWDVYSTTSTCKWASLSFSPTMLCGLWTHTAWWWCQNRRCAMFVLLKPTFSRWCGGVLLFFAVLWYSDFPPPPPPPHTHTPVIILYTFYIFFFIGTSKFWPSLVVLKLLHNLSLDCS